ncbi:TatD family hydrolase [Candidatus Symbiobacter mobilis]|uniref:Mg-dependent DNase n=1 Tax=Candidatus Symbiobacter mobilis CR TaxID=946483 RepID=U5N5Q5_9BURK|nr:TatD family hydrolase [Candidatus Symbiobacter mobilis]AGX86692.1 Mg-dependent DNase [Candidatus Symbiobacter mobilis CR]
MWVDVHCHGGEPPDVARGERIHRVLSAWDVASFATVRAMAHATGASYTLGIHPLYVSRSPDEALDELERELERAVNDPALVAVGEIGLDRYVAAEITPSAYARQQCFLQRQLALARQHDLSVVLHSRRAVDDVAAALRRGSPQGWRGVAHAFAGSAQQARTLVGLGLKLGFGGAFTYTRALRLRRLAQELALDDIVLETDAPDMPPQWITPGASCGASCSNSDGAPDGTPYSSAELPRIGQALAALRGDSVAHIAQVTTRNALWALPRLGRTVDVR